MNIQGDELLKQLRLWAKQIEAPKHETELHDALRVKLEALGVAPETEWKIPNPDVGGSSRIDFLVRCDDRSILIEAKVDGDWVCCAKAAWQLFQARELLRRDGFNVAETVALLGGQLGDPLLPKFFEALGVDWIEVGGPRGP